MADSETKNSFGCVGTILFIILVWALLYGVTINGQHYGLTGCTAEQGVQIDAP